jgi:hypothetical protein
VVEIRIVAAVTDGGLALKRKGHEGTFYGDGNTFYLFFFFVVLGLELRAFTLNYSTSPFCEGFLQDRVL